MLSFVMETLVYGFVCGINMSQILREMYRQRQIIHNHYAYILFPFLSQYSHVLLFSCLLIYLMALMRQFPSFFCGSFVRKMEPLDLLG